MLPPTDLPLADHSLVECDCSVHRTIRAWRTAINPQTPEAEDAFNEMLCAWEDAETDLSYYRVILDGSWPTSVEQLTVALEKAKTRRKIEAQLEWKESPFDFLTRMEAHCADGMPMVKTDDYHRLMLLCDYNFEQTTDEYVRTFRVDLEKSVEQAKKWIHNNFSRD
jgi:hypothetical protein